MPALAAASALLLTLTACVPPADVVVPVEPSHAQPVFASDEEALAAAVEVFEEYAEVVGSISQDGGQDADRVSGLVTDDLYQLEIAGFEEIKQLGIRLIGSVKYFPLQLQQHWVDDTGVANVIVYFCADTTGYQVVQGDSEPYRPEAVPDAYLVEVVFVGASSGSPQLLVKEVGDWQSPIGCSV